MLIYYQITFIQNWKFRNTKLELAESANQKIMFGDFYFSNNDFAELLPFDWLSYMRYYSIEF